MQSITSIVDTYKEISNLPINNLICHKNRLQTLLQRVKNLIDQLGNMPSISHDLSDTHALNLISTTLEEIKEYMTTFSVRNARLANHIIMYGSDEEQFIKWGERLQHCARDLGLSDHLSADFDEKIDYQDFQNDVALLRSNLVEILNSAIDGSSQIDIGALVKSLEKLLGHQSTVRSSYQTKTAPTSSLEIDPKKVRYEDIIGRGGFGVVWRARYRGELVAIKTIPLMTLTPQSVSALKLEANIMRKVSHPRIVSCYGVFEKDDNHCVVMELMDSGSLHDLIQSKKNLDDWMKKESIALDICSGASYLHRLNVIHRDLKPGNIVLDEYLRAKITDFGISVVKNTAATSVKGSEMGTVQYMAPECFGLSPVYSTKSDVYAFAIILWELAHWKFAYTGINSVEIRDSIRANERLSIAQDVPTSISELISTCWEGNPKSRPDFATINRQLEADVVRLQLLTPSYFRAETYVKSPSAQLLNRSHDQELDDQSYTGIKFFGPSSSSQRTGLDIGLKAVDSKRPLTAIQEKSTADPITKYQSVRSLATMLSSTRKKKRWSFFACLLVLAIAASVAAVILTVTSSKFDSSTTHTSSFVNSKTLITTPTPTPTPSRCKYNNPIVSTFAGTGTLTSTDGNTTVATFSRPIGISITSNDNLYISEAVGYAIRFINMTTQTVSTLALNPGLYTTSQGKLTGGPAQMALQSDDVMYVSSTGNNQGMLLKLNGTNVTLVAGSNSATGYRDGTLGVSLMGKNANLLMNGSDVIVFDRDNNNIRIANSSNYMDTLAGNVTGGYVDGDDSAALFNIPTSGAFDSQGNLYVSDTSNKAIRKISPNGTVSTFLQDSVLLGYVRGIVIDQCDNIVVISDSYIGVVSLITPDGKATKLAGGARGYVDGEGSIAQFTDIYNLAQDSRGNIYIPDFYHNVIRKITFS